jgi:hypothetical protein
VFRPVQTALLAPPSPDRLVDWATIEKGWNVSFQSARGAPVGVVSLDRLSPLNESPDAGTRYFSGIASYTNSFAPPKQSQQGGALWLDLGEVGDLAEVLVNGRLVGTLWHAPWRIDIGRAVHRGRNQLEVRVANRWVNRLIGDAQPDTQKVGWTSQRTYGPKAPLLPSGLIGPVRLLGNAKPISPPPPVP